MIKSDHAFISIEQHSYHHITACFLFQNRNDSVSLLLLIKLLGQSSKERVFWLIKFVIVCRGRINNQSNQLKLDAVLCFASSEKIRKKTACLEIEKVSDCTLLVLQCRFRSELVSHSLKGKPTMTVHRDALELNVWLFLLMPPLFLLFLSFIKAMIRKQKWKLKHTLC